MGVEEGDDEGGKGDGDGNVNAGISETKMSKIQAGVQRVMRWEVALRIDRNPQFAE